MIVGYKAAVKSEELVAQLRREADDAEKRGAEADEALKGVLAEARTVTDRVRSPERPRLEQTIARCQTDARLFRFYADHVVPNEVYLLDANELGRFGFLDQDE